MLMIKNYILKLGYKPILTANGVEIDTVVTCENWRDIVTQIELL